MVMMYYGEGHGEVSKFYIIGSESSVFHLCDSVPRWPVLFRRLAQSLAMAAEARNGLRHLTVVCCQRPIMAYEKVDSPAAVQLNVMRAAGCRS